MKVQYSELPNFHQVNAQLYRGAQPRAGGLQTLKQIGIRTIVNLRHDAAQARAEEVEAGELGLRYYSVPLPDLSLPQDKVVRQVFEIINSAENHPVFVHCHHGKDRTGTIIACYRISHDGWTATEARKEAEKLGMSWTQLRMKRYIDKFHQRSQKS
jgi:protein tyrosine/serine phosphatase